MRTKKISELPVCPDEEIDNLKTIGVNAQNESYQVPLNKIKGSAGGGMSDDVYSAIQRNVDLMRARLNTLISDLANLAFRDSRTSQISNAEWTSWPENSGGSSGGDTPSGTPSLTLKYDGSAIESSQALPFSIGQNTGQGVSKTITVKGTNITKPLSVAVTGTNFIVSPTTIAAANANDGIAITVSFNGTSQEDGTLTVSSSEVSETIYIRGSYLQQGGGDPTNPEDPTGDTVNVITHLLNMTKTSGGNTATKGSPYTAEITTTSTYNGDLRVYMGGVNITSQCRITDVTGGKQVKTPNVTGDIMIVATARTGTVTVKASAQLNLKINNMIPDETVSTVGNDTIYTYELSGLESLTSIKTGINYGTNNFINATSLVEVDFGGVPLKNSYSDGQVFAQIFQGCTNLTKVKNIVLHTVTQSAINGIFASCTRLTEITGLNTWDVELATSMANTFSGVPITTLDISGWVCNNITSVASMFSTSALTNLTIGYFNTGTIPDTNANIAMALNISGSAATIHCITKTPPTLNPNNNWLQCRSSNQPYTSSKKVYVKCPVNCLAAYSAGAGWNNVGYDGGIVPQLSEETA